MEWITAYPCEHKIAGPVGDYAALIVRTGPFTGDLVVVTNQAHRVNHQLPILVIVAHQLEDAVVAVENGIADGVALVLDRAGHLESRNAVVGFSTDQVSYRRASCVEHSTYDVIECTVSVRLGGNRVGRDLSRNSRGPHCVKDLCTLRISGLRESLFCAESSGCSIRSDRCLAASVPARRG